MCIHDDKRLDRDGSSLLFCTWWNIHKDLFTLNCHSYNFWHILPFSNWRPKLATLFNVTVMPHRSFCITTSERRCTITFFFPFFFLSWLTSICLSLISYELQSMHAAFGKPGINITLAGFLSGSLAGFRFDGLSGSFCVCHAVCLLTGLCGCQLLRVFRRL